MYDYLENVDDGLTIRSAGKWAAEKLDYLRRYIDVFETSMHNRWTYRNFIDLLAGPGKNRVRETNQILLGSPLLALKTRFPFTGYYFVDSDPGNIEALRERCKAAGNISQIHIDTGDCNLIVDQVVSDLRLNKNKSLNMAFLDPEGLELKWMTVAKLASIPKMDLVINYPQGGLNRVMANVYQSPDETAVDLFFGSRKWRELYTHYRVHHTGNIHRELIDLYKSQLQKLGYKEVVRSDEIGGDEPLMRNTRHNAPLYRLIFASKNPLGNEFWHKITQRDIYGQRRLFDSV